MERVLGFGQGLLEHPLGLLQSINLSDHIIGFMLNLRLPELDISQSLPEPLSDITLCPLCFVVCFTAQTDCVQPQTLGQAPHPIGGQVVTLIGGHPIVGGVSCVQSVPGGGEDGWNFNIVQVRELVLGGEWFGNTPCEGRAGVDPGGLVVGAWPPGQGGQGPSEGRGGGVGIVGFVGGLHGADAGQEGLWVAASKPGTCHVGGCLGVAQVLHFGGYIQRDFVCLKKKKI